jgi:hypothetical protein
MNDNLGYFMAESYQPVTGSVLTCARGAARP